MSNYPSSQSVTPSQVRLFSPAQITVLSFFTGFPVGFALASVNLKRMGNQEGVRRLIMILGLATLVLLPVIAFLSVPATVYSLPVNALCAAYLNMFMTKELQAYQANGGQYTTEKIWNGCIMGILGIIVWALLAAVIFTVLFGASTVWNFRLPGLGV